MGKDPAMPFYVNDWLSSRRVTCMSLECQAAYMRLLCHCWASGDASLPDDDDELGALSGLGERWLQNGSAQVRKCFEPHPNKPGQLTNGRLFELWNERQEWKRKSIEGGLKSGEARRLRSAKGGSSVVRTKREPKGNSSSSSSSSIEEEAKASSRSKREPSAEDFEIAEEMASKIDALPGLRRELRPDKRRLTELAWANEIRLMREQDGRAPPDIRRVFEWANRDKFWRNNILSASKLREKFDDLVLRMESPKNVGRDNSRIGTPVGERGL